MELVSKSSAGEPANGDCWSVDVSADGRWVVFASDATNLTAGGAGGIFIHDRQAEITERIGSGNRPVISADGHFIVFDAFVDNYWEVFLYDQQTHRTEQVSRPLDHGATDGDSVMAQISADGRWVAFWSWASNLVSGDDGVCDNTGHNASCGDVFLYNREGGQLQRVPVSEGYGEGMVFYHLSLSGDGRWLTFKDSIYDRLTGQVTPLCAGDLGCFEGDPSPGGVLSDDGQWVAFAVGADVFVQNRFEEEPELVSIASDGTPGNGRIVNRTDCAGDMCSILPTFDISADGRWIVFNSSASNLVPGDTQQCSAPDIPSHNCYDIFVRDRETGITEWVSKP
jgi:Tol biopolymer transport system component